MRCALLALALVTFTPNASPAGQADNVLVVGSQREPASLDPAIGIAGTEVPFLYTIYDRLVDFDPATLDLTPGLATAWRWTDNDRILEMELRQGVTFHDGTPFDATAAIASLKHFQDTKRSRDLDAIVEMTSDGPYVLRLHVDRPYSVLPAILSDRAGMVVSPKALDEFKGDVSRHPVGTGPFRFVSWEHGVLVKVQSNRAYWNASAVKLAGIEWRIIQQQTSLVTALQTGQIDYVQQIDPVNLALLERNKKIRIRVDPSIAFSFINLNTSVPPLNDVRVRRAISMALDRKILAAIGYGPLSQEAKPASLVSPENYWPNTPSLQNAYSAYRPAEAKRLLEEAGYKDGVSFNMCVDATSGSPIPGQKLADAMREQLKPANITLNTTMVAGLGACIEMFNIKKSIASVLIQSTGKPDPYMTYQQYLASNGTQNVGKGQYGVDDMFPPMLENLSRDALRTSYDRLNATFVDQMPVIPLYFLPNVSAYSTSLQGEMPALMNRPVLAFMSFK
jgi:peptide/nickel transport system permease protein/peptide/nickel transport system substrate-binding protein